MAFRSSLFNTENRRVLLQDIDGINNDIINILKTKEGSQLKRKQRFISSDPVLIQRMGFATYI